MDAAYNRRDADGYYARHAGDWRFVNSDGSTDDLRAAKKYLSMRLSRDHPKRFLSCSITESIVSLEARGGDEYRVVVDQTVLTETAAKGRNRTRIRQEDTWRRDGGDWLCARSRIVSRQATRL